MDQYTHWIDEQFDSQEVYKYDLFLEAADDYFAYAVVDKAKDLVKVIHHQNEPLNQHYEDVFLNYNYRKTKVIIPTDKFTFVPEELYADIQKEDYLKFINPNPTDLIHTSFSKDSKTNILAAISEKHHNLINGRFSDAEIYTQINPFLDGTRHMLAENKSPVFFINVLPNKMELMAYTRGRFSFYNIFDFTNTDEFIYYPLLVAQQLNFKPDLISVRLCGQISSLSEYYQAISEQFGKTDILEKPEFLNFSLVINSSEYHRFFNLVSLNLCEL